MVHLQGRILDANIMDVLTAQPFTRRDATNL